MQRNDGSYYAEGRTVFKAPLREPREDGGADITIGFPVCTASEWVTKEAPQTIADALNAARSPQPDHTDLLPRIKECIEQLRDRLNEIDRWQNGERNSLPAFSQAVIFADRVLIDIREAVGDE